MALDFVLGLALELELQACGLVLWSVIAGSNAKRVGK